MPWAALVLVAFAVVGGYADRLARNPSRRAGLAWGGVLFVFPFVVWLPVALIYDATVRSDSEWGGGAILGLGYVLSVGAMLAGEAVARVSYVLRGRR